LEKDPIIDVLSVGLDAGCDRHIVPLADIV